MSSRVKYLCFSHTTFFLELFAYPFQFDWILLYKGDMICWWRQFQRTVHIFASEIPTFLHRKSLLVHFFFKIPKPTFAIISTPRIYTSASSFLPHDLPWHNNFSLELKDI